MWNSSVMKGTAMLGRAEPMVELRTSIAVKKTTVIFLRCKCGFVSSFVSYGELRKMYCLLGVLRRVRDGIKLALDQL